MTTRAFTLVGRPAHPFGVEGLIPNCGMGHRGLLALQWGDLDWGGRFPLVQRIRSKARIEGRSSR
jgi:hypothetical protein